ncbi:hypothetical protein Tco_0819149 [Tanacetum coccineum]|uniref:Reverse transcriptase Ty1/copia-type domain-containing protein n=1 Tax=Tanacetum coccineum TaxID=301880 RepID=A0ABQ5A5R4_9ASTR
MNDEFKIELRNELLNTMQSLCERILQREQAANVSTHTPEPSRRFNIIYDYDVDDDNDEESTIPLNEITSQIPPITPVLPTLELEDSLIMGSENTFKSDGECDLSSCNDFSLINIPERKSVTFSNPLLDSNDDFPSSYDESLSDEDVPEDKVKIYLNPLFEFDDEYISSDVNPLFDEVLENIKNKDSYVSNLGGDIDEIDAFLDIDVSTDIEDDYYDSEGDFIYLESLLIKGTFLISLPGIAPYFEDSRAPVPILFSVGCQKPGHLSRSQLECAEKKVATWNDLAFKIIILGWNEPDIDKRTKTKAKRTKLSTGMERALVVKPDTIRIVFSLVDSRHWHVHQLDVKNAFLHGILFETIICISFLGHDVAYLLLTPVDTESKLGADGFYVMFAALWIMVLSCILPRLLHWLLIRMLIGQYTLSHSSAEAEYRGVANAVVETSWLLFDRWGERLIRCTGGEELERCMGGGEELERCSSGGYGLENDEC